MVDEPEYIAPESDEAPVEIPEMPVMAFTVQHPGFIPEGFVIEGASASQAVVRGFVPDVDPQVAHHVAVDPTFGVCPYCGKDFRDKRDPGKSLKGHLLQVHK
jgi:hypothetical protein